MSLLATTPVTSIMPVLLGIKATLGSPRVSALPCNLFDQSFSALQNVMLSRRKSHRLLYAIGECRLANKRVR